MLKRLKQQVTEAVNAVNERTSSDSASMGSTEEKEGFVCPQCMHVFPSPDELSDHFLTHTQSQASPMRVDNANIDDVNGRRRSDGEPTTTNLEQLVEDLRAQLREEKWYSAELKKELERINAAIAQSNHVPEEEVPYLMQQIQVMEAGKSMVTQRLVELEKEGMGMRRAIEGEKSEKADIMKKLKELTARIREITDENEKHKVDKERLSSELIGLRSSAQKLEKELVHLNQTLQERPSEDDVLVLKNELVNAQKIMDEITKEKEVELSEQHNSIRMLSQEREKQHMVIQNLEKQLAESGTTTAQQDERVLSLERSVAAAQEEKDDLAGKLKRMQAQLKEESSLVEVLRAELKAAVQGREEMSGVVMRSTREAELLNESNQARLEELHQKMQRLVGEKSRVEADLRTIEERNGEQQEGIKQLEQSNLDLTNEVSSLNLLLEKEKEKLNAKKAELEEREKELREAREKMAEEINEKEKAKTQADSMVAVIDGLQRENQIMRENAALLRSEITEGESGMKMAMDQLHDEKERLKKEVAAVGEALKLEKESASAKVAEMEKRLREAEHSRELEGRKRKEEAEALTDRLNQADEEILKKTDRFTDMEREMEEERRKAAERLAMFKEAIQAATTERDQERTKAAEATRAAERLEKEVREKERQVADSRASIEDALARVRDAEEKAARLESELSASCVSLATSSQLEKETSKRWEDEKKLKDEANAELEARREEVEALREEIVRREKEDSEQQKHNKAKLLEKEEVIAANEKMNEELMEREKDREKELERRRKALEDKEREVARLKEQVEEEGGRLADMEKEREESATQMAMLQASLVMLSGAKEELEKTIRELRENAEESSETIATLEGKLEDEEKKVEGLIELGREREKSAEETMTKKESQIEEMRAHLEEVQASLMHEREGRMRLEKEVKEKNEEIESFLQRISGFEEKSAILRREVENREKAMYEKDEHVESINRASAKALAEWEERVGKEEEKSGELTKLKEQAEGRIEQLSNRMLELESSLAESGVEAARLATEAEEAAARLEVELQRAADRDEAAIESERAWKDEREKIRRSLESALSDRSAMEKQMKEAMEGMELLTVKNMELVQATAAFDEEKSALIERCLNTESDLDFERERAMENKHRFDEAIAAMHELGRANQSLQMDMNKMTGRKWLDDSEALNCTHCAKLFSLTLRKHHCRVCGFIFCAGCSSKTIRIASCKNPVRVCDHCHSEAGTR